MFTIKMSDGYRERILEAESFTILHENDGIPNTPNSQAVRYWAKVTLHNRGEDVRYDIGDSPLRDSTGGEIQVFQNAYIENAIGKTVKAISFGPR